MRNKGGVCVRALKFFGGSGRRAKGIGRRMADGPMPASSPVDAAANARQTAGVRARPGAAPLRPHCGHLPLQGRLCGGRERPPYGLPGTGAAKPALCLRQSFRADAGIAPVDAAANARQTAGVRARPGAAPLRPHCGHLPLQGRLCGGRERPPCRRHRRAALYTLDATTW